MPKSDSSKFKLAIRDKLSSGQPDFSANDLLEVEEELTGVKRLIAFNCAVRELEVSGEIIKTMRRIKSKRGKGHVRVYAAL